MNHDESKTELSDNSNLVSFNNIPGSEKFSNDFLVFKTRVNIAWQTYLQRTGESDSSLSISPDSNQVYERDITIDPKRRKDIRSSAITKVERAKQYSSQKPDFSINQLILPEDVKQELLLSCKICELEKKVFQEWGLNKIQPYAYSALNFHGHPGTGKTLAAHAIASYLNRNILLASYAQIESMYHGEGPKNVEALFYAAERDNSILFIDESDSLLSKRLTNITQGSEQAINSMRSQLLISLEMFRGIVIFATNLVQNYDNAFETRVRNIYFPMPDARCRHLIWESLIPNDLPLEDDVCLRRLSQVDDVCGRDIRNAIIDAALRAAERGGKGIKHVDLEDALLLIKARRTKPSLSVHRLSRDEQKAVDSQIGNFTDGSNNSKNPE
jgi:SpoVK/Ycf46/Vps4 family AAA+-type ATPase